MKLPNKIEKFNDKVGEYFLTFILWVLTKLTWKECKEYLKKLEKIY